MRENKVEMIKFETINIMWKSFDDALPDRNVWIYVTPPNGGFLEADHTTLMPNIILSRETGISGNFVGRIQGAKGPFDLQFLTWDVS